MQKVDQVTGMTPAAVKKLIRHHIQVYWRDLLPAYDEMVSKPSSRLYYDGPPFTIVEKTEDYAKKLRYMKIEEDIDVDEAPIYLKSNVRPDAPQSQADATAEKRPHSGGSTSASSTVQKRRK